MDYALQLLLPILGGLMLGYWLNQNFGLSPIWMVLLAILGMMGGLGILYKRAVYSSPPQKLTGLKPPRPPRREDNGQDLSFLYKDFDDEDDTDLPGLEDDEENPSP